MSSPAIVTIAGESSGKLKGKDLVGAYWKKALELILDIQFEPFSILTGVDIITLYYKGSRGGVGAEVFHFDSRRKVERVYVHYAI